MTFTTSIADLEVEQGKTWRTTQIADVTLNVWVSVDKGAVEYKAAALRGPKGNQRVDYLRIPHNLLHLDRAFEHAVQEVIEDVARREAARQVQAQSESYEPDPKGKLRCAQCGYWKPPEDGTTEQDGTVFLCDFCASGEPRS